MHLKENTIYENATQYSLYHVTYAPAKFEAVQAVKCFTEY